MRMGVGVKWVGLWLLLVVAIPCMAANASGESSDKEALTQLLHEFMAGATVNDAAVHDRFWAPDLVYTSSSGERFGKAEIMEGLQAAEAAPPNEPVLKYSAEDIRIQLFGDTAVVAFMLIGTKAADETAGTPPSVMKFYNTGTFVRREGSWQAVAWQATRIPAENP